MESTSGPVPLSIWDCYCLSHTAGSSGFLPPRAKACQQVFYYAATSPQFHCYPAVVPSQRAVSCQLMPRRLIERKLPACHDPPRRASKRPICRHTANPQPREGTTPKAVAITRF